jgi:hypothetical protein
LEPPVRGVTIGSMPPDRTPPQRNAAAAGVPPGAERVGEPGTPAWRPSPALLVRLGGRWCCRHDLAAFNGPEDNASDVQLRP